MYRTVSKHTKQAYQKAILRLTDKIYIWMRLSAHQHLPPPTGTGACGTGGAGAEGGACGGFCIFASRGVLVGLVVVLVDACC